MYIDPGSIDIFTYFFFQSMRMECFSISVSSTISFRSVLLFLGYRSFTSLVRFIPRYLMLLGAIVNGINSLISLSSVSLLVYRNVTDFLALILYLATLLNCYMTSSNIGVESFEFSIYSIMSSAKREGLTSSLPI
uniref:Uncharacterized protein n=2 Tax=Canis lupus familiaris TaxID=9615 RepID=A0A8I3RQQ1_CANLF